MTFGHVILSGWSHSELPGEGGAWGLLRLLTVHQPGVGGALLSGQAPSGGGVVDESARKQLKLLGCIGLDAAGHEPQLGEIHCQAERAMLEPTTSQLHPTLEISQEGKPQIRDTPKEDTYTK